METRNVFWGKGAAWLVTVGLIIAIIPRLLNLGHVWFQRHRPVTRIERVDFWLNLLAIIAAIVNAFVHSRDAYAMVPDNVILSVITVALLGIAHIAMAINRLDLVEVTHGLYGAPVGVAQDRDGGLLIADDVGNTVWRVTGAGS